MNAEILCVGTELVLGDILNTNAQYLSKKLAEKGINVYYQSSVGDNPERIIKALSTAVSRSNLIIFTGGLGPTADDITIETVTKALNIPLEKNEDAYNQIVKFFEVVGREMPKNNEKQAFLPKGCVVLPNDVGTAPGCVIESGNQSIAFLPGVPSEMKIMFEKYLDKYLDKYSDGVILSKFVHVYGIGESKIDEMAKDFIKGENPSVAPYAKQGETELRVTAKAQTKSDAQFLLDETVLTLSSMFGDCVYGYDDVTLESVVVNLLKQKKKTVATAESCTAGYISKRITDISGASQVFKMGVTTYSNESKTEELSVPAELIKEHGAVSSQVAACMAKGIRLKSGADFGVSITGIAGPKSDESKKPVGLSYIGISDETGEYVIESRKGEHHEREYIRYTSASEAINFLRLKLVDRMDSLNVEKTSAVLLSEMVEEPEIPEVMEEKPVETKEPTPSYLTGVMDELATPNKTHQLNISTDEFAHLKEQPKFNDKENADVKIAFDENEYTPVEDEDFEQRDIALEIYETELAKEKQKGSWKNFFIRSLDTKQEIARKITLYIAIVVFICSACWSVYFYVNPVIQQAKIKNYAVSINTSNQKRINYYSDKVNPKFASLLYDNEDTIGWITIDGTKINYPVLKSKEAPDFYMRRGFDKTFSREGSIFADEKAKIEYKKESKNIVLYGHHMTSTGTMFKDLDKYTNLKFYKKHPTFIFDTLYRDGEYKVFAVMITNSVPEQDNGNFYNYMKSQFRSDDDFIKWVEEAKIRSMINTNVDVNVDDEILTLQTCNDSFKTGDDKARLVVMARRVRDDEASLTDTSSATLNENPKYPQMWYDENSQVNPYYSPEENKVLSPDETITQKPTKGTKPKSTATTTTIPGETTTKIQTIIIFNDNPLNTTASTSSTKATSGTITKAPSSTTKAQQTSTSAQTTTKAPSSTTKAPETVTTQTTAEQTTQTTAKVEEENEQN